MRAGVVLFATGRGAMCEKRCYEHVDGLNVVGKGLKSMQQDRHSRNLVSERCEAKGMSIHTKICLGG